MIAIPCVIYIDGIHKPEDACALQRMLDRNPVMVNGPALKGELLPDMGREPYPVGNYETVPGPKCYNVRVHLNHYDPKEVEPDDAKPGEYPTSVYATNSFEAQELALDRFHETHAIGNLDNAEVTTGVIWPEDCQHNWQIFENQAAEKCTVCMKCGSIKPEEK
jgi:hypothetical protein